MDRFRTRIDRLMSHLNKKHPLIKFEFKYSQTNIEFLNVKMYKDQNNMLQTTVYSKQTDQQNYLDAWSEHPKLLKNSILFRQALQIKWICSSQHEFLCHTTKMINQFRKCGYNRSLIEHKIDKANSQEREQLKKKERHCRNYPFIAQIQQNTHSLKKKKLCYETLTSSAYKPKSSWNISQST